MTADVTLTATYVLAPPLYNTHSKYGFSFEYPKGMSINEVGAAEYVATNTSGGIVGELINDKQELVNIYFAS